MKTKVEKKQFEDECIYLLLVGKESSKKNIVNIGGRLAYFEISTCSSFTFCFNRKRFNIKDKYAPEELESLISEVNAIIYIDATDEEICHWEKLRKNNPDCIAIDLVQTGLNFGECLDRLIKVESQIAYAKSITSQAKALDNYKSELFLLGNNLDERSCLQVLPPEVAKIIAAYHVLSCNYSSFTFFKKMPEQTVADKTSTLTLNI